MGRPAGKSSEETRAAIVAAARAQFERHGYERATNRSIAEAAGVTSAAIYQYFPSKPALYAAVAEETMCAMMPDLEAAVSDAAGARAAFCALLRSQLGNERQVMATRFMAAIPIEMHRHPEVAEAMVGRPGPVFELVLKIVNRGVETGEIAADRAEQVVGVYIAALIGLSIHGRTVPASHNAAAVEGLFGLLDGTLFGAPGSLTRTRRKPKN